MAFPLLAVREDDVGPGQEGKVEMVGVVLLGELDRVVRDLLDELKVTKVNSQKSTEVGDTTHLRINDVHTPFSKHPHQADTMTLLSYRQDQPLDPSVDALFADITPDYGIRRNVGEVAKVRRDTKDDDVNGEYENGNQGNGCTEDGMGIAKGVQLRVIERIHNSLQ